MLQPIILTMPPRRDILKTEKWPRMTVRRSGKRCADAENKISVSKDFCHSVFCRRRIHNVCSVDTVSVSCASALSVSGMRDDTRVCFAFARRSRTVSYTHLCICELFLKLIQLPFLLIGQRFAVAFGEVHTATKVCRFILTEQTIFADETGAHGKGFLDIFIVRRVISPEHRVAVCILFPGTCLLYTSQL